MIELFKEVLDITEPKEHYLTSKKANPHKELMGVYYHVIHGTSNWGYNARCLANINYFNTCGKNVSTQRIIDDIDRYRIIEKGNICYGVGATSYTKFGEGLKINGHTPNFSTVNTEWCTPANANFQDVFRNGVIDTIQSIYENKLSGADKVCRHFDITGKLCPDFYIDDVAFNEFKQIVDYYYKRLIGEYSKEGLKIANTVRVDSEYLNIKSGFNSSCESVGKLYKGEIVTTYEFINGYYHLGDNRWISAKYTTYLDAIDDLENEDLELELKDNDFDTMMISDIIGEVYTLPDVTSKIIKKYNHGDIIKIKKIKSNWYELYSGGWIHSADVSPVNYREIITFKENKKLYYSPGKSFDNVLLPENLVFKMGVQSAGGKDWISVKYIDKLLSNGDQKIYRRGFIEK